MLAGKVEAGNLDLLALRIRQIGLPPQDVAIFNALAHEYYQEKTRLLKIDSNGDRFVDAADGKISSLLAGLSESSRKQFFAFLQGEKRGMNISPYDIGLSASVRLKPPVGDGHVHLTSVAYHPGQPQPMPFGMTPNYSSYMPTGTIDSNHNYYAELDLSGNTINCTMSQCFQNVHQGRVTLTIGSYGGTAYGSYVAPASWLSVQKYFNFPMDSMWDGNPVPVPDGTAQTQVFCQVFGASFFNSPSVTLHAELAIAYVALNVPGEVPTILPNGDYQYDVNTNNTCSAKSKPPDWDPNKLTIPVAVINSLGFPPPVYWAGFTECLLANNIRLACVADWLTGVNPSSPPARLLWAALGAAGPWKGTIPQDCTNHGKLNNDIGISFPPWSPL
jgi:hypothetical protein